MYSRHWQMLQTGKALLRMALPSLVDYADVEVVYDRPPAARAIYEARLSTLKMVPTLDIAHLAYSMLSQVVDVEGRSLLASDTIKSAWGIHISGIGTFTPSAIKLLPDVIRTKKFVERIREMLTWIDGEVQDISPEFAVWFCSILLDEPGIMSRVFQSTSSITLSINSVLYVMKEIYIDDEVVRAVMEIFSNVYGSDGRYIFIPPLQLTLWKETLYQDWEREQISSGQVEKAFAVVHMPGHWGALQVDFTRRQISFGDSLSLPAPRDTIQAIEKPQYQGTQKKTGRFQNTPAEVEACQYSLFEAEDPMAINQAGMDNDINTSGSDEGRARALGGDSGEACQYDETRVYITDDSEASQVDETRVYGSDGSETHQYDETRVHISDNSEASQGDETRVYISDDSDNIQDDETRVYISDGGEASQDDETCTFGSAGNESDSSPVATDEHDPESSEVDGNHSSRHWA
ncbi:hypothetical protein BGZ58_004881, partial [Dissophora ornata]